LHFELRLLVTYSTFVTDSSRQLQYMAIVCYEVEIRIQQKVSLTVALHRK